MSSLVTIIKKLKTEFQIILKKTLKNTPNISLKTKLI